MANRIQLEAMLKFVGVQVNPGIFNQISRATAGMTGPLQQFNQGLQQSTGNANNVAGAMRGVNQQLNTSQRAAGLFIQRMSQFAILLPAFATLNHSLQSGVKFLFDFDDAIKEIMRTDIAKLGGSFEKIAKGAFQISEAFGTSAVEAANTIKTYIQAGYDLAQSQDMARLSILATKASTLDAADAVEFLLSVNKQFGLEGGRLEDALDGLVNAESLSAVEARDIAEAFKTGGNSMAQFGKDINDGIGMISALREQTRKSGSEIGTFFKTLQTRMFAAGESRSALESLGVSVQNLDGTLRPTLDVLTDLKGAFEGMTEAQQANAAKAIAGVRQFESLLGALKSIDRATQLSAASANAHGSAQEKAAFDAKKLSRALDDLKVAGQEVAEALGKAGATDLFKEALHSATALLHIVTELAGTFSKLHISAMPILLAMGGVLLKKSGIFGRSGPGTLNGGMTNPMGAATTATAGSFVLGGFGRANQRVNGLIGNSPAAQAGKFLAMSVAISAVTGGLNKLADNLKDTGTSPFTAALSSMTADLIHSTTAAGQMAAQFALLSPKIGAAAGAFEAVTHALDVWTETNKDATAASKELAEGNMRDAHMKLAPKMLTAGLGGEELLGSLSSSVKGKSNREVDLNRAMTDAFHKLSPAVLTVIKNAGDLKEVLLGGGPATRETIHSLAMLDSAAYTNKEAIQKLRDSYDEAGHSSLSSGEQLKLLLNSLGMLDQALDKTTGRVVNMIYTFKDMKAFESLISQMEAVNNIGRALSDASLGPKDMLEGIDKLRVEAGRAKEDLGNAQAAFEEMRNALITKSDVAGVAGLDVAAATKFVSELSAILDKPNSTKEMHDFLLSRSDEERAFAEEFKNIDEKRRNAVVEGAKAQQALESEIYKRGLEDLKAQQEAAASAADSMARFKNELIKVGTSSTDTGLLKQITSLTSADVAGVLSGKSDMSQALQDVINDTFVDGVKKAETGIKKVAEETANSIVPLELRIGNLRKEIEKLNDGADSSKIERAHKQSELGLELEAKQLEKQNVEQDGYIKGLEALRTLTVETKKAQEEAARAEAERLKKTQALTDATYNFSKAMHDVNKNFAEFSKQKIDDLAKKQASAYEEVKSAEQGVLSATSDVSSAYKEYISTIIQVNGALAEAKIKANMFGRDIGMLNGSIVTFQDKLTSLNKAFGSVLEDSNMKLDQRIQLERQLADETLSFLKQAQDQITSAGINVFGQSAGENQGLQKGIAGLSFVAEKLGGSFQNFMGMKPDEVNNLSKELLNLPVEFRKSVLDALSFLPSTTSIGGFSADQLKQAIGQVGAGVAPEAGLPAIADLTAQQVDQLKILGQLGNQEAKLQLTQVLAAQKAVEKAQEQLDVAKIQEERAREGFEQVRQAVNNEMAVLDQANTERRELLQKVVEASNTNALHDIENQAQLFADQNSVFRDVGDTIVQGISQAINAKMSMMEATTSLGNFNTMQSFGNQANGFIPNFSAGNLSPREAAGILHAAAREKKAMPNGAQLAVANTHEAIIPMYRNFAEGNQAGSDIAAGISSIRSIDQTMVAAIARSVQSSLSTLKTSDGSKSALDKIAGLLTELNSGIGQVRDSNLAIKNNTAGLTASTTSKTPGAVAGSAQEIKVTLQTNQNNTVQITGLEKLRDELKTAISETTSKQVAHQLEGLMAQLDPVFQALNERGIISSFGQSR
jgi:TP901 family phage tail tape measure protein